MSSHFVLFQSSRGSVSSERGDLFSTQNERGRKPLLLTVVRRSRNEAQQVSNCLVCHQDYYLAEDLNGIADRPIHTTAIQCLSNSDLHRKAEYQGQGGEDWNRIKVEAPGSRHGVDPHAGYNLYLYDDCDQGGDDR